MLDEITYQQFIDWVDYFQIEPFGAPAEDRRHSVLMAMYANQHRDAKKRKEPWRPEDFALNKPPESKHDKPDKHEGTHIATDTLAWLIAQSNASIPDNAA